MACAGEHGERGLHYTKPFSHMWGSPTHVLGALSCPVRISSPCDRQLDRPRGRQAASPSQHQAREQDCPCLPAALVPLDFSNSSRESPGCARPEVSPRPVGGVTLSSHWASGLSAEVAQGTPTCARERKTAGGTGSKGTSYRWQHSDAPSLYIAQGCSVRWPCTQEGVIQILEDVAAGSSLTLEHRCPKRRHHTSVRKGCELPD